MEEGAEVKPGAVLARIDDREANLAMKVREQERDEARQAIAQCRSAGIAVKMITGDHVGTAIAIARQLALDDDPQAMSGAEKTMCFDDICTQRTATRAPLSEATLRRGRARRRARPGRRRAGSERPRRPRSDRAA
mgnify:CR=1 FL=1